MSLKDAWSPWLPTLQDVEVRKDHGTEIGQYYEQFGWEQLVVPADCPRVASRMGDLKVLFDQKFAFRMLNSETLEQWQIRLQSRFDRYVHIYERAYTLYEMYEQDMLDDMKGGEIITRNAAGTGSTVNTPDSITNASDDYADARTRSKTDETIKTVRTGEGLVDDINAGFEKYIDIDQDFISRFEDSFLNIFWY